jgi:hypothetical protein
MTGISGVIETLDRSLGATGLFVRGGFRPEPNDGVPDLADGRPARTVVLIGNAGGDLWNAFEAARAAAPDTFDPRHPLDRWLRARIEAAAAEVGAQPIFPNDGPPFVPLLDWAQRAETVFRSPIGIMIHPEFGLWHVYRAVLLFAQDLDVPARKDRSNPCETCEQRPCLGVCPVDAFEPGRFAAQRCADHVASEAGTACRERGCLARRACPVGPALGYPRPAQAFHTAAMVEAVRRGYGVKP